MDIDKALYNNLVKYFKTLSFLGYVSLKDQKRLLVLSFIEEFLVDTNYDDFVEKHSNAYLTENDYRIIQKAINCLSGNCLIPFNGNCKYSSNIDEFEYPKDFIKE